MLSYYYYIISPISYRLVCIQLSPPLSFSSSRIFPLPSPCRWERRGALLRASHFRSADCTCVQTALLAWFDSVGLQQAALRHRNNRNVPKASAAKTVPLAKCLLQKTVSSSPGYENRLENVSSSTHDSCQTRSCLTSGTASKPGRWCCRRGWAVSQVGQEYLVDATGSVLCWWD